MNLYENRLYSAGAMVYGTIASWFKKSMSATFMVRPPTNCRMLSVSDSHILTVPQPSSYCSHELGYHARYE